MNRFLVRTPEVRAFPPPCPRPPLRNVLCAHTLCPPQNGDFNQYWYSADTIAAIIGAAARPLLLLPPRPTVPRIVMQMR